MKSFLIRLLIYFAVAIAVDELLLQLTVRWKESSEEFVFLVIALLLAGGAVWAVQPLFTELPTVRRIVVRSVVAIAMIVGLNFVLGFYNWHVRPNVGLYEEPDWVSENEAYAKKVRARIEANRW